MRVVDHMDWYCCSRGLDFIIFFMCMRVPVLT